MGTNKYQNTGIYRPNSIKELLEMCVYYVQENSEAMWTSFCVHRKPQPITLEIVKSGCRIREAVMVRQLFVYFAMELFDLHYIEVMKYINRDRTMYYSYSETMEADMKTNPDFGLHVSLMMVKFTKGKNNQLHFDFYQV